MPGLLPAQTGEELDASAARTGRMFPLPHEALEDCDHQSQDGGSATHQGCGDGGEGAEGVEPSAEREHREPTEGPRA